MSCLRGEVIRLIACMNRMAATLGPICRLEGDLSLLGLQRFQQYLDCWRAFNPAIEGKT